MLNAASLELFVSFIGWIKIPTLHERNVGLKQLMGSETIAEATAPEAEARSRPGWKEPGWKEFNEFLDKYAVAARLGVSIGTINNWTKDGLLPVVQIKGRLKRYHWPSVEAAMLRMQRGGVM